MSMSTTTKLQDRPCSVKTNRGDWLCMCVLHACACSSMLSMRIEIKNIVDHELPCNDYLERMWLSLLTLHVFL